MATIITKITEKYIQNRIYKDCVFQDCDFSGIELDTVTFDTCDFVGKYVNSFDLNTTGAFVRCYFETDSGWRDSLNHVNMIGCYMGIDTSFRFHAKQPCVCEIRDILSSGHRPGCSKI